MGKKFKALILDFDGTLVDANFYITPEVKDAVSNLEKKGIIISLATGRPFKGIVKKICKDLNLLSPQIVSGGAEIIDPQFEKVLWYEHFPAGTAKKIINYFLEKIYDFSVESEGAVYIKNAGHKALGYGPGINFKDLKELNYHKVAKLVLSEITKIDAPKILEKRLTKLYKDLHFIRSGIGTATVLDITSQKATKHLAVLELSKILKIHPENMIGVGDGYNDYPLLSVCGYKVAMENAPKELKKIADLVIPDVSNNGLVTLVESIYNTH